MSYANGTTHYNLPQTTGTDKRDWSDTNQGFRDIDAALYQATQDTAQAALDIEALEVRMDTAEQNIATNAGDISALDGRVTTVEGTVAQQTAQIADVRQDSEDMICAYNEASATSTHAYAVGDYFIYNDVLYRAIQTIAIGDTIVPDTNCTTTNVSSELLSLQSRVVASTSSDGLKAYRALFHELYTTLISFDLTREYLFVIELPTRTVIYHAMNVASNYAAFFSTGISSGEIVSREILIGTGAHYLSGSIKPSEVTINDNIDDVPPSGWTFKIIELTTL